MFREIEVNTTIIVVHIKQENFLLTVCGINHVIHDISVWDQIIYVGKAKFLKYHSGVCKKCIKKLK